MINIKKQALDLVQDSLAKSRKDSDLDWTDIKEKHPIMEHSSDILRRYSTGWKLLEDWGLVDFSKINISEDEKDLPAYKETTEILAGGVQRSDKLIKMDEKQSKDVDFMLKAHGFDPNEFELISVKNNIWNVSSKTQGVQTLYSSKISVKPKADKLNVEKLMSKFDKIIKKSEVQYAKNKEDENMLVIPFFDMHFGVATFKDYQETLQRTIKKINSKTWSKILIIFGQDLLHNDGFTGQTTSGTIIDKVDMEQAWADALAFYTMIFDESIFNSKSVDAIFSNGNHDQSMGWAFGKLLEQKYSQVKFDSKMKQFKGYVWENIFIGATHGDKGANRIFDAFLAEYGKLIALSNTKEILSGHIHHQKLIDKHGLVHRTLGTGALTDGYHEDNGFVGAQKQFQILEYNKNYPEAVYYV